MAENPIFNCKFSSALDYVDGNADRNGAIIDMAGYDGVLAIIKLAAIAGGAVTNCHWEQDDDVAGGGMDDLAGTGMTIAADDDNQIFINDLYRPQKRYVRIVMDKDAANNCAESVIYIRYGAAQKPVVQTVADAVTYERNVSPDEGAV